MRFNIQLRPFKLPVKLAKFSTFLVIRPNIYSVFEIYSGSYLSCLFSRYINEMIEYIIELCTKWFKDLAHARSTKTAGNKSGPTVPGEQNSSNQGTGVPPSQVNDNKELDQDEHIHPRSAEWAKAFEAATLRRTEVLTPENLENMWTIGRNYKKDFQKKAASEHQPPDVTSSVSAAVSDIQREDKGPKDSCPGDLSFDVSSRSQNLESNVFQLENNASVVARENSRKFKRSNSISALEVRPKLQPIITGKDCASVATRS